MFGLRGLRPDREISGFETAFSEIAPRLAARGHRVTIYGRSGAHSPERRVATDSGVELRYMPSPGGKNFSAVTATALAVAHALATQSFDVWFFVNVGMGHHSTLAGLAGRPIVMNVDGLDWQRGKWGPAARAYFQSAARAAVRRCTTLITDAEAMRAHYRETFGRDSEMIAYGASIETSEHPDRIATHAVRPREYYLIVSRLIPENTLEALLEGFHHSRSRRTLIVAGGATYHDAFHRRLGDIAARDDRIRLVGHVSDQATLKELWCNCYAYLHGHSVGGTNPSLLRAMGCGAAVAARDTVFNREVLDGSGRLFTPDADAIAALIDELDDDAAGVARLRLAGPERIRSRYTWDGVVDSYERVFKEAAATFRGSRGSIAARPPVNA
jgi:glycosyltransferase involved in cell wall biosynthesis